jgi:3-oxoacyl-[acyl-carrier protein] reductase
MSVDLEGKTAIVTGASKGIGYSIAEVLVDSGANVVICARSEDEVNRAADQLTTRGPGRAIGLSCDVRKLDDVRRLVSTAAEQFGSIDILVNNAGLGRFAPVDQITPEQWHEVIETNLNGVFYACHASIPHMRRGDGGWIINIGSLAGKNAFAGGAAYNASKFGLVGFTEALMLDVRHDNIRVSSIMPGSVDTHFSGSGGAGAADWKLQGEDIAEMVLNLLAFHPRALPSRVEMRPSRPPRK